MSKSDQAKAREHRLALKLRENLRRRKAPDGALPDDAGKAPTRRMAPREDEPGKP